MATRTTKKVSLIETFKKEYNELYAEAQQERTKNRVFELMDDIQEIEQEIDSTKLSLDLLEEQKIKINEEINSLGVRK